ncbi:hypothetical protein [Bosea sp. RAC05]|uniref:hypothetical protein n=1 Tax=Bosea sp. RAC05 TaxID=1842539 RepID=UPI00083CE98C|nr:hypothetical protein [Bosea sp. RAC05]AOG03331.1 hypothetical protein BSY19_4778 [Bosea sp. RAC05]
MDLNGQDRPTLRRIGLTATSLEPLLDAMADIGHRSIGEGHHATVYDVPGHPSLVVRAGNGVDGMATYIVHGRVALRRFTGIHVPVVHDLQITDCGGMVVLAERLEEIPDEPIWQSLIEAAEFALQGRASPDQIALLADQQPDFMEFARELRSVSGRSHFDTREGNFMLRGGDLILSDPFGQCLFESEVEALRSRLPLPALGRVPQPSPRRDTACPLVL